jgi:hypothetical protein
MCIAIFVQVAIWEDGKVRHAGQVVVCGEALQVFADSLGPEDEVAIEATCNTYAIVHAIEPRVARVIVSNPDEDSRDRRGKGQDRQGRRRGPRRTAGGGLSTRRYGSLMRARRRCAVR